MRTWRVLLLVLRCICQLLPGFPGRRGTGQYRSKNPHRDRHRPGEGSGLSIEGWNGRSPRSPMPMRRVSAGRHLTGRSSRPASHDKAIDFVPHCAGRRWPVRCRQPRMLRELAQVYLLVKTLRRRRGCLSVPCGSNWCQAGDSLLLAQAYYQLGNLARAVGALDPIHSRA